MRGSVGCDFLQDLRADDHHGTQFLEHRLRARFDRVSSASTAARRSVAPAHTAM